MNKKIIYFFRVIFIYMMGNAEPAVEHELISRAPP